MPPTPLLMLLLCASAEASDAGAAPGTQTPAFITTDAGVSASKDEGFFTRFASAY